MTFCPQRFHVSQYLHIETRTHMKNIAKSPLLISLRFLVFIIITFNSQRSPSCESSWKKKGMYKFLQTLNSCLHTTIDRADFRFCRMLMTNVVSCCQMLTAYIKFSNQ
jgi:hypothetical protein